MKNDHVSAHLRAVGEILRAAAIKALAERELREGSRWIALFPRGVAPGAACIPDVVYQLAPRPDFFGHAVLVEGQRLMRLMTHPRDAQAGWHISNGSLKFSFEPISPVVGEFRFDALHWALNAWRPALAGYSIIEQSVFEASAILRSTTPQPMIHGLWLQVYDGRCRPGSFRGLGEVFGRLNIDDVIDEYLGIKPRIYFKDELHPTPRAGAARRAGEEE